MDWRARDTALERLGRLGKSGGAPKGDTKQAIDELQRRASVVAQAAADTLGMVFRGPRGDEDADIFTIDCRTGGNILTSAQASAEGLGAVNNLAVFRHGRGFTLDYYVEIRRVVDDGSTWPAATAFNYRLYAVDDNRTVFQVTDTAISQDAVITVSCFPSKLVPANGLAPSSTGAARGKSGYILATEL